MENYKTTTNCNPDKDEKMALQWSYPKETHWIHTEVSTRLASPVGLKAQLSQKDLEEDDRGRSHGSEEDMGRG
jgi:hypothetical protein